AAHRLLYQHSTAARVSRKNVMRLLCRAAISQGIAARIARCSISLVAHHRRHLVQEGHGLFYRCDCAGKSKTDKNGNGTLECVHEREPLPVLLRGFIKPMGCRKVPGALMAQ